MEGNKKIFAGAGIFSVILIIYVINSRLTVTTNINTVEIANVQVSGGQESTRNENTTKSTDNPPTRNTLHGTKETESSNPNNDNSYLTHQGTKEAESSDPDSDNLYLISPPPQSWIAEQFNKTLEVLGYTYSPPNDWFSCQHPMQTYYFPNIDKIFTGVPKSGCSNWIEALLRAEGVSETPLPGKMVYKVHGLSNPYRMRNQRKKLSLPAREKVEKAFSFTVLRNPWTRLVSGYRDKLSDEVTQGRDKRLLGIRIVAESRGMTVQMVEKLNLYPTFEEFLQYVVDHNGANNIHFLPQNRILCIPQSRYDVIVPLEYAGLLHEEIFRTYINTTVTLLGSYDKSSDPRKQTSARRAKEWFSKIKPDLIEKLYEYYKADFTILNYSNFTDDNFPLPLHSVT